MTAGPAGRADSTTRPLSQPLAAEIQRRASLLDRGASATGSQGSTVRGAPTRPQRYSPASEFHKIGRAHV